VGDQALEAAEAEPEAEEEELDLSRVYVSFSAEINANTTESLLAMMSNLANQGAEEVVLLLSTPGGNVMNGINLYNVLRAMPFHLITHNVGNVDSIGSAIFLAGEERYACPHSTFMFHGVTVGVESASARLGEKNLGESLASVQADQKRIGAIIEERTNLEAAQIEPLFLESQTKDSAYAVGTGIVHEVKDVDIAPGDPVLSLVFERQGI
jgi:ATP-dependent protease ClpP protease subunit